MPNNHLTTLYVVRFDGTTAPYPSNHNKNREKGIIKLKAILENKEDGHWEIAYLYDAQAPEGTPPFCAFHYTKGTEELDKVTAEALRRRYNKKDKERTPFKAYCIPNLAKKIMGATPYPLTLPSNLKEAKKRSMDELRSKQLEKVLIYNQHNEVIHRITA